MTPEDRQQLREIIREETAATERHLTDLIAETDKRAAERDRDLQTAMQERQDRAVEAIAAEISATRVDLLTHLDRLERRIERTETNTNSLLLQTAGISKSLTTAERLDSTTSATLAALQRAHDQMHARIKALEDKAAGQQPPQTH